MKVTFKLPLVMALSGIPTQKALIERIHEIAPEIKVRPVTISNLVNNKIVHLPVELIAGICAATNSKPNDWIEVDIETKPDNSTK